MKKNEMIAKVYKIRVVGPIIGHESIIDIIEVYVPNEQLHINLSGKFNTFIEGEKRYDAKTTELIGEIGIDRDLVKRIIFNMQQREEIEDIMRRMIEEVAKNGT